MITETDRAERHEPESDRDAEPTTQQVQWCAPDFVEQSACAEICAYVFTA